MKGRRFNEAIFWLKELEDTYLGRDVRRLLLVSWAMNVGLARLAWLKEWCEWSTTAEGRLRLCWQLLRCSERDSSIWWLLWSGVVPVNKGQLLVDKWNSTWHLEDFWSKINHPFSESLQHDMKNYEIFTRAVASCLDCDNTKCSWAPMSTEEPIDLAKTILEWNSLTIRQGRVYEIPYGCLYGMTHRGTCLDTSEEINTFNMSCSPYWRRTLAFYTINGSWISDDMKELFFDTHFPDDIVDEWSLPEKRKSHGPGVHCVASLGRWWAVWVCEGHKWISGDPVYKINEWVNQQRSDVDISCIERLINMYA
jgi:hypothetical protein